MRGLALLALVATGCATVLNEDAKPVTITSNPPGALVYANGVPSGHTPLTLYLPNSESHQIRLEVQGYAPAGCFLGTSIGAGWVVLDVLLGVFPLIIDALTGDWNSLDQTVCHVQLYPYNQPYPLYRPAQPPAQPQQPQHPPQPPQ